MNAGDLAALGLVGFLIFNFYTRTTRDSVGTTEESDVVEHPKTAPETANIGRGSGISLSDGIRLERNRNLVVGEQRMASLPRTRTTDSSDIVGGPTQNMHSLNFR